MRQGQQNRRGRGRGGGSGGGGSGGGGGGGGGGRKPQNPLSRNFESNGPDVKIRGTAAHIAEKYVSLARDALSVGDIVQAENYLQHAEHYNRIIMAAQTQYAGPGQQPGDAQNGSGGQRQRTFGLGNMDDDGSESDDTQPSGGSQPRYDAPPREPEPRDARPREGGQRDREGGFERRRPHGRGDGRNDVNGRGRGSTSGSGGNGGSDDTATPADETAPDGALT